MTSNVWAANTNPADAESCHSPLGGEDLKQNLRYWDWSFVSDSFCCIKLREWTICLERCGSVPKTDCEKSDAAPLFWLAPIDWKQWCKNKIKDVQGFGILTVTGGLANQSWWITWLAFLWRVKIAWFEAGRNDGSCLTSTLKTTSEGQEEGQNKSCPFEFKCFRLKQVVPLEFEWFKLTSCCRWSLWHCWWGCCCCCDLWLEGVSGRFSWKRMLSEHCSGTQMRIKNDNQGSTKPRQGSSLSLLGQFVHNTLQLPVHLR